MSFIAMTKNYALQKKKRIKQKKQSIKIDSE